MTQLRLIPDYIDPVLSPSQGEQKLFHSFQKVTGLDDWIVLHSLNIAQHVKKTRGEADFVIIAPGLGVLVLEVKGCTSIRRDGHKWYYGKETKGDERGPFQQAEQASRSLLDYLRRNKPELKAPPFFHAVVFTHVCFQDTSAEWRPWQIIDREMLDAVPFDMLLKEIFRQGRAELAETDNRFLVRKNFPTVAEANEILQVFRPEFYNTRKMSDYLEDGETERVRFTEEQFDVLDMLPSNPRIIFPGLAGTGKTLLAMEAARRACSQGSQTLMLCYNKPLGETLAREAASIPNLHCSTIHNLMYQYAELQGVASNTPEFWKQELPGLALAKIRENNRFRPSDFLVVDEAQDVLCPEYKDFLNAILRGGLRDGNWCLFGDFSNQNIYHTDSDLTDLANYIALLPERPAVAAPLRKNCRNTPKIVSLMQNVCSLKPNYQRVLRDGACLEPQITYYNNAGEQTDLLVSRLEELLAETLPSQITILSFRGKESAAMTLPEEWKQRLARQDEARPDAVTFSSVHRFKGLESPIVIMTDVAGLEAGRNQTLFYTGASRALDQLFILAHRDCRPCFEGGKQE